EDASATGAVARISPVVDPTSGTVRVTVNIDPGQDTLRPGQFVKVRLEVDRHDDVMTIPRRALVYEDGEPIAWIVADAPPEEETPEEETDAEQASDAEEGGLFAGWFGGAEDEEGASEAEKSDASERDQGPDFPRRVAERRALEVGFEDPERVEILTGLQLEEMVVVVGNTNLRSGTAVRLPDDPAPRASNDADEDDEKTPSDEG
ncbi:MAG: hypothetical protein AAFV53_37665, partial [Myxococcota bacterium]